MRGWMAVAGLLVVGLMGCGGGDGGGSETANVNVTVRWGERSRALDAPSSALSAVLTLTGASPSRGDFTFTIERDAAPAAYEKSYTSPLQARTGTWHLLARFYSDHAGGGSVVGTAFANITLKADGSGIGDFVTSGTVATVQVPSGQGVGLSKTAALQASATDGAGASIVLKPGAIFWSVVTGSDVLSIGTSSDNLGLAQGLKLGTATVVATVDGVSSVPQAVTVDYDPTVSVVPETVTVYPNGSVRFSASVASTAAGGVIWTVVEGSVGGSVAADGTFVAPATPGTYHVRAASRIDTTRIATATVTVPSAAPPTHGIYALDGNSGRVVLMDDITGAGYAALGTLGSGPRQFLYPGGMAFDNQGRIYVADSSNGRIARFDDITGKNWVEVGARGSGDRQFANPLAICVGADGRIYVADTENNRIVRMDDMTGAGWTTFSKPLPDGFFQPRSIAVDSGGKILFGTGSGECVMNDMTGAGFQKVGNSIAMTVGADGRIYYTDGYVAGVEDDLAGTNRQQFGGIGSGVFQFRSPASVSRGADGRIYVADYGNARIVRMDDMLGTNWRTFGSAALPAWQMLAPKQVLMR